jgi:allophanate hydrolase subunit 2
MLTVLKPGILTSIQDKGRFGLQKFGVPAAGAMDPETLALANLLAGNDPGEACLEIAALGPALKRRRPSPWREAISALLWTARPLRITGPIPPPRERR